MGTFYSRHRRNRQIESPIATNKSPLIRSKTTGQVSDTPPTNKMYSPFRQLRRGASNSAGSLITLPSHSGAISNFSYPYPRTHTTLVVPSSAVQQRDRAPLFDDSPTSGTNNSIFGNTSGQFRRPPLNRAIPPIPESKSNESIVSQLTYRHSISGTSVSISQREPIRANALKEATISTDNSVVIENKMAQNLGARIATNLSEPVPTQSVLVKKSVVIITTKQIEEPTYVEKPTRLPLSTNKKTRTDIEPKSPLLSMAHSLRSRINRLGKRIERAASRSPIRSSRSMISMRRDTSNIDKRLSKSTSEQPVVPPTPPTTSPPNDEDLEQQPGEFKINCQRSVSQIPRRLPATTLIPSPVGIYFRRLPEEDRLEMYENEGPILAIDSKETLLTPDESPAPILLLRKVSDEITKTPLENIPQITKAKRVNFRRHKHSHSFGGDSSTQVKTPKMTARLIVRQPSEPIYLAHKRSKSRDAIIDMGTPRVALKQKDKAIQGDESVKTTRSLKIVTYTSIAPEMTDNKGTKKAHKKSRSVDISTVCAASKKYSLTTDTGNGSENKGSTKICLSASASKADEMRLHKGSLIPRRLEPRTVRYVNKKRAPLAIAEQTRVANSPAVELPPNGFEDEDLKRSRQSRLQSPTRVRRMIFWRSKSKSTNEKTNEHSNDNRNNNSKSVDQTSPTIVERIVTKAHITTRAQQPSPTDETDSNGNKVQKTDRESRLDRLTLLLNSPLTSHKRIGNTRALQAKQRSGLIDDEITDQPMLISTELALIDEQTPSHSFLGRDLNENFETMASDSQRTVRVRENDQTSTPVQYVPSAIQQQPQHVNATSQPKISPHEHAAIEKIIEDLSSQLSRIKEYAIEDEGDMQRLRAENSSLREELQIKDQVIQLLMSRLKDPASTA